MIERLNDLKIERFTKPVTI